MKRSEVDREKLSPMMRHYVELKDKYVDTIILYRLGDFYEMFFEDALVVSHALELTLTGKSAGLEERVPMCGIPHHAADIYIDKLIKKGFKVAICEQLEDPKSAKGIVKRDVVKIVTPGTITELTMLDEKKNNYIAAILFKLNEVAISFCDVSTGEFMVSTIKGDNLNIKLLDEISRINPSEIVIFEKNKLNNVFIAEVQKLFNI